MSQKKGWAWDQLIHAPRSQAKVIGKQEGTPPRRARNRKRKSVSNINDKMRAWRDAADGSGLPEVRRALLEVLEQFDWHLKSDPVPFVADAEQQDLAQLSLTVEAIRGTLEESEKAGRKRIDVAVLKEILGA